jgi:hypothetical protein
MARAGALESVTRGVYVRPKTSTLLGRTVPPAADRVVAAIAHDTEETIGTHGAEAARRFGLSTQVSMRPVYATTGRTRIIRVHRGQDISLVHHDPATMQLAGRPAGDAVAALLYLGPHEATAEVVDRVLERPTPAERDLLRGQASTLPAWLAVLL